MTENIEKVHRAVARASVRTGAPIMAHSRPASETGPRQIEIFEEEGVDLSKVQIAHTGDTDDLDYIERLLEKGVYIGMDRYGLEIFLPFEQRNATVTGPARARLRRPDVPLRGLLRDARLVRRRWRSSSCSPPGWRRTGASRSCTSG